MTNNHQIMRVFRLASSTLPIGAFSYSQGLEWEIENRNVRDPKELLSWLRALMFNNQMRFELPIAASLFTAWGEENLEKIDYLNSFYFASKDCSELRDETLQMGQSLKDIFNKTGEFPNSNFIFNKVKNLSYPTVLTYALSQWKVDIKQVLNLLLWTWLENQVIVAIKLIPIGHSAGQKIFFELEADFEKAINQALETDQSDWSNFHPMQSMACAKHQFQYSRMFRS